MTTGCTLCGRKSNVPCWLRSGAVGAQSTTYLTGVTTTGAVRRTADTMTDRAQVLFRGSTAAAASDDYEFRCWPSAPEFHGHQWLLDDTRKRPINFAPSPRFWTFPYETPCDPPTSRIEGPEDHGPKVPHHRQRHDHGKPPTRQGSATPRIVSSESFQRWVSQSPVKHRYSTPSTSSPVIC